MDSFSGKHVKKQRHKKHGPGGPPWFSLVNRWSGLFAGVGCHTVVLLLLGMVFSLHDVIGVRYETLLDLVAIFLVVLLVLLWQMRWTYPLSNEVPLIILLLWVVLSSRISTTHCFCCHEPPSAAAALHTADAADNVVNSQSHAVDGADIAALSMASDTTVAVKHPPPPPDGSAVAVESVASATADEDDEDFLLSGWRWLVQDCRAENFNFLFSLLCLIMVFSAFFTELRSSVVSLLFRLTTASLVTVVAVIFLVSPSLCSKFNAQLSDSFVTVMRITLFEVLWALNRYSRGCERTLSQDYQQSVQLTTRHLLTVGGDQVPAYIAQYEYTTPRAHNMHMTKLWKYLSAHQRPQRPPVKKQQQQRVRHTSTRAKSRSAQLPLGPIGGSIKMAHERDEEAEEDDDDYHMPMIRGATYDDEESEHEEDDEEESEEDDDSESVETEIGRPRLQAALPPQHYKLAEREERESTIARVKKTVMLGVWQRLYQLSHAYRQSYIGGLLSWKNRGHSKRLLHLIDLTICVWVLLVCSPFLWFAALEIVWLLYYITQCKKELASAQLQSAVLGHLVSRDTDFGGVAVLRTGV